MADDLLEVARGLIERAAAHEQIEAFLTHERSFQVKTYGGAVESLSSAEPRGAGVRVVTGQRVGFAFTTDLSEAGLTEVLDQARQNSAYATEDEAAGLAEPWTSRPPEVRGLVDPSHAGVTPEDKVAFALELERATKAQGAQIRAVEEAAYSDSDTAIAIATSTGLSGAYRRTDAWCYSIAIAAQDSEQEMGFDFGLARGIAGLDSEEVARRSAARALEALGGAKIPSARMPIVFDPYVAGQFLGVLSQALTGEAVQKGRSLLAGRLGEQVAAENLSLVDDGRLVGAPSSAPWDAEGVPTGRTDVIKSGVLESFLYDTTSARRDGRASTGNASRGGFKSMPSPSSSNLSLDPTGDSAAGLLERAGDAFLVQDFHGVHSGANPVTGDFSVGASGRLLEGGAPGQPVKEVTVAAPMLEILRGIVGVADDRRWLPFGGSYGGATTLVAEMTVGGLATI